MQTFLITILVIGILIIAHELGHFAVARLAGVRVEEFAIGFGPRVIGWVRRGTRYSVRAIPLGGFVRMAGMFPETPAGEEAEVPPAAAPKDTPQDAIGGRFLDQPVLSRMAIIMAGPVMNFLLAILLFFLVFGILGVPSEPTLVVAEVTAGLPAAEAGIVSGDLILSVDGQPLKNWEQLVDIVKVNPDRPLEFLIERNGRQQVVTVTPQAMEGAEGRGYVGIRPVMKSTRLTLWGALAEGARLTVTVALSWFQGIAALFRGTPGLEVRGIVGIGEELGKASRLGLASLVFFTGFLSANLGLLNLLPVPALDGSRLVFLTWEGIRGRPVDPEKESFIHLIGFALLILLAIVITYQDILRLDLG